MDYFAKMPEVVVLHPELSSNAVRLYAIFLRRAGNRGWFYDGMPRLAQLMQLSSASTKTVRAALTELERVNAVRVHRTTKENGHHGGNRYTILPHRHITGVDPVAIHNNLSNGTRASADRMLEEPEPSDPWSDDPTPWSDDPEPLVERPSRPDSPSEPSEITAASPSATRSTAAPPDGGAPTRDDYRYEAQWHGRARESSEDRAVRLVAWALTNALFRDYLPSEVHAIVAAGKEAYEDLDPFSQEICDAVDTVRNHNVNSTPGADINRLSDAEIKQHLLAAMAADDLTNLIWRLDGMA